MIKIEHDFTGKITLDKEEERLSKEMKQSARYGRSSMTRWYIDQLADHLKGKVRKAQAGETASLKEKWADV